MAHQQVTVPKKNPQSLIDQFIRDKIYKSSYWREQLFGANAETILDKATELRCIGGVYSKNRLPCEFICLLLKMLQIQPEQEIILSFIQNERFKYLTVLGLFYYRLMYDARSVYTTLEPYYADYRKIIYRDEENHFTIMHIDEIVDKLLHDEFICSIGLPRITRREVLENNGELEPRISVLQHELDQEEQIETQIVDNVDDDAALKNEPLDKNSDEYWIELRKRAGLD